MAEELGCLDEIIWRPWFLPCPLQTHSLFHYLAKEEASFHGMSSLWGSPGGKELISPANSK